MGSKLFGKDSVNIYYNLHYKLIEPDCASIIRYGHYNNARRPFKGKFKDISKNDSTFVVAEGCYSDSGLKNGEFIIHYLNGRLQAKGNFINDKYDGNWVFYGINGYLKERSGFKDGLYDGRCELYNDDGTPNIVMNITGDKCQIIDKWTTDGKRIMDVANKEYVIYDDMLIWRGQLLNGLPDGVWKFQISNEVFGSEVFDKGQFLKGVNTTTFGTKRYKNKSRIKFLPEPPRLAIINAESLIISSRVACDGTDYSKFPKMFINYFDKVTLK